MRNSLLLCFGLFIFFVACKTQKPITSTNSKDQTVYSLPSYQSAYTKRADLVNTKLFLTPAWKKKEMTGTADITLHQHFYPSDSIVLNARGMTIEKVCLVDGVNKTDLKFEYDLLLLTIRLPRVYFKEENITIEITYVSKPENLNITGSVAIKSDKGLYFVNVDSIEDSRPTELWTQGETESNSVWFPTIESPEQKTTTEIYLTVDTAFETLSNGLLLETINNSDGTNTWHWKQDLPAAPYLVMIAVGNFAVVKDFWNGIAVNYYVDPPYEKYARMVFGKTPEMLSFFSTLTGITYPWQSYNQIVVHDYVSGAMENVTAVVHGTNMQQDFGSYLDDNYEHYISHELFHHWAGNLVTCRSWSNITLNEGFANYSEFLWNEYKYGRTFAESNLIKDLRGYLRLSKKKDLPLIRYQYENREDVYDQISYNKGGCVLHMLRTYLGDSAFFKGINIYLTQNKFSSVEVDDLRQAFERTSGEDLNWFFNQWFLKGGHPQLSVTYKWDDVQKKQTVTIKQLQDLKIYPLYKLPLDIDFYLDHSVERKRIVLNKSEQAFEFVLNEKPKVVSVDAQRSLVGTIDNNRTDEEIIYLFDHSKAVRDRSQAVTTFGFVEDTKSEKSKMIRRALKDSAEIVRSEALIYASIILQNDPESIKDLIFDIALHDSSSEIRSTALQRIKTYYKAEECVPLFQQCLNDRSHKVVATAFSQLNDKSPIRGAEVALQLESDSSSQVLNQLTSYYADNDTVDAIRIYKRAFHFGDRWEKYNVLEDLGKYIGNNYQLNVVKEGINLIFTDASSSSFDYYKNICAQVLLEVEGKLHKSENSFSAHEKLWLKYNPSMSKEKILAEISDLQIKIETVRNAIKKTL